MSDQDRLLVITHPVLAKIERDEIDAALRASGLKGQWDKVEIKPVSTTFDKLDKLDWPSVHAEQKKQLAEKLGDEVARRGRVAYFGMAPIPLALDLGYRVGPSAKVHVFQRHHKRLDWIWMKEKSSTKKPVVRSSFLPAGESEEVGPVAICVSTSHPVRLQDVRSVVPSSLHDFEIGLETPDEDGLETQQVFDRVVDRFKEALSAANRLFRNRTQFHLLAAIPVGLAFKLGTQINPTIYPEVVTYQYWSKGAPRYNPAIVLGGKTEIDDGRPATRAGGFLDVARFDWTKAEADELRELLANAYSSVQGAGEIVARAGIDRNRIRWSQPAWNFWGEALDVAAMAGRTRALVESARADTGIAAYHARLDMLLGARPAIPEAVANKPITWKSKEVITGQQETFLEIHFLHEALRMSASVVRLMTTSHDGERALGTGFLIAKDTILTNHHVLFEGNKPKKVVTMLFNYELDASGKPRKAELREGDVATIEGHEGHDWAIIRTAQPLDPTLPIFSLRPSKPAEKGDFVFIIQHPAGRPKKIGLLHNEVVSADADTVQYLTDTLPGSSGSPVCNEHWEVVALHSGSVEGERESLWKNEGTTIARVHDGLVSRGILQAER